MMAERMLLQLIWKQSTLHLAQDA
ncbi:uncharacterized protein METZ01_LOCUS89581 [marine metagenome]|uniref:Uncharacterized protein n=1 Tax=marine metagenome TaxID=408172 RepID=A0A381VAL1_9ZZZZ